MTKGREKSDGRVVPEVARKGDPTNCASGGKATTRSQQGMQLTLFAGTADSSKEADVIADAGRPASAANTVPKPANRNRPAVPAMTMSHRPESGLPVFGITLEEPDVIRTS